MSLAFSLVVHTANILGVFSDPFEFAGDYGSEVNSVRDQVFDLVISKEALTNHLTNYEIKELMYNEYADQDQINAYKNILITKAKEDDYQHGPMLAELITPNLIQDLIDKQKSLSSQIFSEAELNEMLSFLEDHKNQRVFYFFRHIPSELNLDKTLRDKASRAGSNFNLPILSSPETLKGNNECQLKKELLHALFTDDLIKTAKSPASIKAGLLALDQATLVDFFGSEATHENFHVFTSPAGQIFFYWLYQSLNLHLISQDQKLIEEVNKVKTIFANTMGNPAARADSFKEKLIAANASVVFTQESDTYTPQALSLDGLFYPVNNQTQDDGTFVFLRRDVWEPDYQLIAVEDYEGYRNGHLSLILATKIDTREKFLLAAAHGHHTKAEDGRLQISLIMQKFHELAKQYPGLQLLIGTDANTKTEADVHALRTLLDDLGLVATSVGPTTIKKRMVTAQHSKVGRNAFDEEDYLITLKQENGGLYLLTNPTVGFREEKPNLNTMLPNLNNQSDHYSVGAAFEKIDL